MDNAEFHAEADFTGIRFQATASFNNSEFQNTTSFEKASFGRPPEFFETEIHEDVDFSGVDWESAEQSYSRWLHRNDDPVSIRKQAGKAVRAWDRLALIMGKQDKLPERHDFFRLKMHAQRQRDGFTLLSAANWLFDTLSDYGWGVRRAFSWWIGHIAMGAVILADGWQTVGRLSPTAWLSALQIRWLSFVWVHWGGICMMCKGPSKVPPVIPIGCSPRLEQSRPSSAPYCCSWCF
ncbi:MAG: pentapeptide repeat-containing protein [Albidovulum sp.]|nr:pentapeptide repeat-containing protein [Albidovulum sp.]